MSQLSDAQKAMVELFQRHVQAELDGDLDTTMATMTDSPHLNHVPTIEVDPICWTVGGPV